MKQIVFFISILIILTNISFAQKQNNDIYKIVLNGNIIVPVENFQNVKKAINSNEKSEKTSKIGYTILQFYTIPTLDEQAELEKNGVVLLNYIQGNAYYAYVNENFYSKSNDSKNVRSVYTIEPSFKIDKNIFSENIPDYAKGKRNKIKCIVIYFDNADLIAIENEMKSIGCTIIKSSPTFSQIYIEVTADKVNRVAAINSVQTIQLIPAPDINNNYTGRAVHKTNILTSTIPNFGYGLTGDGVKIGIWDADVRPHRDFGNRVINRETEMPDDHGSHVTGTVLGSGVINPKARGMAPKATMFTWNFNVQSNNLSPFEERDICASKDGIELTQNSYGSRLQSCPNGLTYNINDRGDDKVAYKYPYLLHVFSNGNDQDMCSYNNGYWTTTKNLKNSMHVGSLDTISRISYFSSCGPTVDGRLFPDICGIGEMVFSTVYGNNYDWMAGTSMATPGVTGTLALLYERYHKLNNNAKPLSSLMKALICNTAHDLGNPGPDYKYGYGEINGLRALELLDSKQYFTGKVSQGQIISTDIIVPLGVKKLNVMIVWTDKEGTVGVAKALVNDLDLSVIKNGQTTLPWICNPERPSEFATRGVDNLNNIEQVTVENPVAGTYTIKVNGTLIPEGVQEFSVVYDFVEPRLRVTYPVGEESLIPESIEIIRWDCEGMNNPFTLEYSLDNGVTYNLIAEKIPANSRNYYWKVPAQITGSAKIRIISGSAIGESKKGFSIMPTPVNVKMERAYCFEQNGAYKLSWDLIPNAKYEILKVKGEEFEKIAEVNTNSYMHSNITPGDDNWFSVRAIDLTTNAISERSVAVQNNPVTKITELPYKNNFNTGITDKFYMIPGKGKIIYTTYNTEFGMGLYFEAPATNSTWMASSDGPTVFSKNPESINAVEFCEIDATALSGKKIHLKFDLGMSYNTGPNNTWFRVLVNGSPVTEASGNNQVYFTGSFAPKKLSYDLSEFAGKKFTIRLEHCGKDKANYADYAYVDNLEIFIPENDIQIVGILPPESITAASLIKVLVKNNSGEPTTEFPVSFSVNNSSEITEVIATPILPFQTLTYTFNAKADFSAENLYKITATSKWEKDVNTQNNTSVLDVINNGSTVLMGTIGSPKNTCAAIFTDDGGKYAKYTNGLDKVYTFLPGVVGNNVQVRFSAFGLEKDYDYLYIYNGNSINSPLINIYTGNSIPEDIVSSAPDGSITFRFISDPYENDLGWVAEISCSPKLKDDVGVSKINLPLVYGNKTATETISIRVTNAGSTDYTNVPVHYQVNNGIIVDELIPTLNAASEKIFAFTKKADLSASGTYLIKIWTSLPADLNHLNDTLTFVTTNGYCKIPEHNNTTYGISKLSWDNFENTSGITSFSDFTNKIIPVTAGKIYQPYINCATPADPVTYMSDYEGFKGLFTLIVVDWDNDGDFTDNMGSGEYYYNTLSTGNIPSTKETQYFRTGTSSGVLIPNGFAPGLKRMRIIHMYRDAFESWSACLGPTFDKIKMSREDFEVEEYLLDYQLVKNNDVGVNAIINPAGPAIKPVSVTVSLKNYGLVSQSSFPVVLLHNGNVISSEMFSGSLGYLATVDYTFATKIDISTPGEHIVTVNTGLANDMDNSNNEKSVTIKSISTVTSNVVGHFDGVNDIVTIQPQIYNDLTNKYTFEAWINLDEFPVGTYGRIFDKGNINMFVNGTGSIYKNYSLVVSSTIDAANHLVTFNSPENSIKTDTWQHIALTVDETNNYHIYIDGVEQNLIVNGVPSAAYTNANSVLTLGNRPALNRAFKGQIDEVRIWNVARTSAEIINTMNNSLTGTETNLIAYYKFAEGSGQYVVDYSSNNNFGKIENANISEAGTERFWSLPKLLLKDVQFKEQVIPVTYDKNTNQFNAVVSSGTGLNSLAPSYNTVTNSKVLVSNIEQVSGISTQDFTNPVEYTVSGKGINLGITQSVKISVVKDLSSDAEMTALSFKKENNPQLTTDLNFIKTGNVFTLKTPGITGLNALKANCTVSAGAKVVIYDVIQDAAPTNACDFSKPLVVYVISENKRNVKAYFVNFEGRNNKAEFLTYTIPNQVGTTTINNVNKTIDIKVAQGTDLAKLAATFTVSPNAKVRFGTIVMNSGIFAIDYSKPVKINISSEDETVYEEWIVTVSYPTAIDTPENIDILVFPNPTNGFFTVKAPAQSTITVFDINGRVMNSKIIQTDSEQFDISELPSGTYIVRVIQKNQSFNKMLIKQ